MSKSKRLPLLPSGFGDVSFPDKEVVDLSGFVHIDLDEGSCLGKPQAPLLLALVD